jgi:hypothetical protein
MSESLTLKVTNTFTGEIFTVEVEPYKLDSLVAALLQVQKQRKALDQLEFDLKKIIEEDHLAKNDYRPLASSFGYDVRYIQSATKSYDPTIVWNHLDHDLLLSSKALTVSNTNLEKLMAELVRKNELPVEDSQAILGCVETKQRKPYVKLEKINREDKNETSNSQANAASV